MGVFKRLCGRRKKERIPLEIFKKEYRDQLLEATVA